MVQLHRQTSRVQGMVLMAGEEQAGRISPMCRSWLPGWWLLPLSLSRVVTGLALELSRNWCRVEGGAMISVLAIWLVTACMLR